VAVLMGHVGTINAGTFATDADLVATAGDDVTVRIFYGPPGELLATLAGHEGPVRALAVSPDGRSLASAGDDTTVRVTPLDYESWLARACGLSRERDGAETRRLCAEARPTP